jgi:Effector-associated domain 1
MNPTGEVIPQLRGPDIKLLHASVIASYDYQSLKQDLFYELDQRLELISADGNFETVVFQVLDAARRGGWLRNLLEMFREGKYPDVKEVAIRLLDRPAPPLEAAAALGAGPASVSDPPAQSHPTARTGDVPGICDPYLSYVIGQQRPFINRSVLRLQLKDLLSESTSRVLIINGNRPCGKSYTWFFVRQPELLAGITPVLVDLSEWKEPSTPMEVMSSIALQLGLDEPAIDGHAQEAAQARRLRDWLVGKLQQHDANGHWLLVFDSLDHLAQREETLQLIEFVAGAAIRQRLPGLRVILLGYVDRLPIDPLDSVLTEEIGEIGEAELREFFRLLSQQVKLAMSDEAVDVAARSVLDLLPAERALKLRQLPKVVRDVGNAAFGRKVL